MLSALLENTLKTLCKSKRSYNNRKTRLRMVTLQIWSGQERSWKKGRNLRRAGGLDRSPCCFNSEDFYMLKKKTRSSHKAVRSTHSNHGFFKLLSCLFLPIIFTLGNSRCCLSLGKFFSDVSFRQTATGQAFNFWLFLWFALFFGVF